LDRSSVTGQLVGLERIHVLQHGLNLRHPAMKETWYGSAAMREFMSIDPEHQRMPDEATVLNFGNLLERHEPGLEEPAVPPGWPPSATSRSNTWPAGPRRPRPMRGP
jgi:hypothetical protein